MEPFRKVTGKVQALDRADIDTDQIIPKQFLKRVERAGFGEFLFHDWRRHDGLGLDPDCVILVTGRNFGCGSSREHAPWALHDFGYRAIVAPSFADIFHANCTKIGLLPVVLPEEDVRALMVAAEASVGLERQIVSFGGREVTFEINADIKRRLLEGLDDVALTLGEDEAIEAYERERAADGVPFTTRIL